MIAAPSRFPEAIVVEETRFLLKIRLPDPDGREFWVKKEDASVATDASDGLCEGFALRPRVVR